MKKILSFHKTTLLVILCSVLFLDCKKKTSDPEPDQEETDNPTGYYIKAEVNGNKVSTADGVNGYIIADATVSGSDGNGGIDISYDCSFQDNTTNHEKYFELSLSNANSADGNDSDEMVNYFAVGTYVLDDGLSPPYYTLSYNNGNGVKYKPDPNATPISIQITEVIDLGVKGHKRVLKVKGQILSGRLYEYIPFTGFTSNYVDITNLDFVIRFTSAENSI
jgi:hypothetical protein